MSIKILIVDDQKIVRDDLRKMIDKESDLELVAEADGGWSAVRLVRELLPDVVIMDVAMPYFNGIKATRLIHSEFPNLKVIALSMYSDKQFVKGMFLAGAVGYLLKDHLSDDLITAIHCVVENKRFFSTEIASQVEKNENSNSSFKSSAEAKESENKEVCE